MKTMLKLTMMAVAAMLMVAPASAVTLSYSLLPLAPGLQPVPAGVAFNNVVGDAPNVYRDIWENTGCDSSCPFNSVSAGGSATYAMPGVLTSLWMMWGSPDANPASTVDWNVISFYLGNTLVDSVIGDTIAAAYVGMGGVSSTGFISVLFSDIQFDKIVLTASQNAFEHAFNARGFDAPPEVPLPAGLVLLMSGLLGLGVVGRRRAKTA